MALSRLQFSLRGILLFTFWMAVCFGFAMINRSIPADWDWPTNWPRALKKPLMYLTFSVSIASPFLAFGALIGRTKAGLIVGISAVAIVLTLLLIFVIP